MRAAVLIAILVLFGACLAIAVGSFWDQPNARIALTFGLLTLVAMLVALAPGDPPSPHAPARAARRRARLAGRLARRRRKDRQLAGEEPRIAPPPEEPRRSMSTTQLLYLAGALAWAAILAGIAIPLLFGKDAGAAGALVLVFALTPLVAWFTRSPPDVRRAALRRARARARLFRRLRGRRRGAGERSALR